MTDKALSMIGLATKAGKIASGEFAVESAVRKGKACLVIIASDASDNTKKSFNDMGAYYHVPVYIYGTKESLGTHTGRGYRASLAVLDAGFGKSIRNLLIQESISDSTILTEVAYVKNQST